MRNMRKPIQIYITIGILILFNLNGCESKVMSTNEDNQVEQKAFVGDAEMLDDGTIVLNLFAQKNDAAPGATQLIYPLDHKDYKVILRHIGNIKPGEKVGVRPWPDK
jgi:hypothetical protein